MMYLFGFFALLLVAVWVRVKMVPGNDVVDGSPVEDRRPRGPRFMGRGGF